MSWEPTDTEIESLSKLPAAKRYEYLIKKVSDEEAVWSLWHDGGWALATNVDGQEAIPIWPHSKYASLCAKGLWVEYEPRVIELTVWLDRWIPGMEKDKRLVAAFPTDSERGILVKPIQIGSDIRRELDCY
ncbi:MAG: DUF2750 domain-containing protein [Planctomycetes bacterium]|nr:DUF2750 domain-containing protein [Planctomycetota bacterium]